MPAKPRGIRLPIDYKAKRRPVPGYRVSKRARLENEVNDLVSALVDAAQDIGIGGVVNNPYHNDFYLHAGQLLSLLPPDRPEHKTCVTLSVESRVPVAWPRSEWQYENELRNEPLAIVGLLMRKVINGEREFFTLMAEAISKAKKLARAKGNKLLIHAHKVAAVPPDMGLNGDGDWFTRLVQPPRESKSPYHIWQLCQQYYRKGTVPTRRDIREHLTAKEVPLTNLRITLQRMGLDWLKEGPRPRQA